MKKIIIIIVMLISLLNADIEIQQNIRALYKNIKLTDTQKEYLLDNHDENIEILKKSLKEEVDKLKINYIYDKNIVSFKITADGKINRIIFLKRSDNNKLNKAIEKAIKNIKNKLVKINDNMIHRFIISYRIGQDKLQKPNAENNNKIENIIIPISNGTTRFQHDSKEYIRLFTTRRDGFVNLSVKPDRCAIIKLLTNDNQKIHTGYYSSQFNTEIIKGTYKLLIKTKRTCDISLQYL